MQEINSVVSFVGNIPLDPIPPNQVTVANQGLFIGIPGCLKTCHVILVGDWHPGWGGFQQLEVECMACSQGHSEVIPLGGGWGGGKWLDMV